MTEHSLPDTSAAGRWVKHDARVGEWTFEPVADDFDRYVRGQLPFYPFAGPKTSRFSLCGALFPPPMAGAVIGAARAHLEAEAA